jgi:2-methylaconitate cis-trans-isomerase PrpF
MEMYRCSIVRGGTSKGIFILENELPKDQAERDKIILSIYGSPDLRQIDGLGGADTLTSKLAIIGTSTKEEADVDYTFGQVSMTDHFVDYGGNCGNISSAVGGFAIDKGLVSPVEPMTTVRIHMTNTGKIITAEVPVVEGKAAVDGDFAIDGCPGTGAKITIDWSNASGGTTGSLLPTGNAKDIIKVDDTDYEVSIVDAGNVHVFIRAEKLGLNGDETPNEIDSNDWLMEEIEKIRGRVCQKIGLVENWEDAKTITPYQPFFAMVSPKKDYTTFHGNEIKEDEVDFLSRLTFMLKMHKAYPITGTVCTGAAARVPGSIVYELLSEDAKTTETIRIGHPQGIIPVVSVADNIGEDTTMKKISVFRTARTIMDGYVYVRKSVL